MRRTHEEDRVDSVISANRKRAKHIGLILERVGVTVLITSNREYSLELEKNKYNRIVNPEELKEFLKAEKLRIE